ncbi:MAG: YggT family protein [Verrucomicrobiales bacterium]|nr:YggT family protein [Verrucomicrobiales bacterium]
MGCVDFILNLAGVLLWIKWWSLPFDPIHKRTPATLVGTLRRAAPSHFRRWHLLLAIGGLLFLRAVFYWQIGSASTPAWVGKLHLETTVLTFASNSFGRMLLFSTFSFGLALGVFYVWLLLLSILAGPAATEQPVHRLVRIPLGGMDRWPCLVKIISPFAGTALLWWLASWLLVRLEIVPRPVSAAHRIEESLVIGLGSYLAWKFLAAALLVLRLLNTYIYFGKHPFWNYVNATAQVLLAPLQKIPLRAGRADFAPVVGIVLVFFAGELLERSLVYLYARLPF